MKGDREDDPTLIIQPVDKLGRPVSEELLDVARRDWKRVVVYAQQQGQDGAVAAEVLEATIHWLSALSVRHPRFKEKIRSLEQYVFVVTVHRLNRMVAKEALVEYVGSLDDLDSLGGTQDWSWVTRLEDELLLKEAVGYLNKTSRRLFSMRRSGYSWEEIGSSLGTTAKNVRTQFSQGVARARRRMMGKEGTIPTPEKGRSE